MTAQGTRRGTVRTGRLLAALAAVAAMTVAGATGAGATGTKPSVRPSAPQDVQVQSGPGQLVVSW